MKIAGLGATVILSALLLSGCSTYRGVQEFATYQEAFQQARSASDVILDRLAVAERAVWRYCANYTVLIDAGGDATVDPAACKKFDKITTPFRTADAAYLIEAGDPPQAGAFRRAMMATAAYSDALGALASGQTADAVSGQIGQLVALASSAASSATPPGAAGSLGAAIGGINASVAALRAPIAGLFGFVTRAEFRDQLLGQKNAIEGALDGVIDATPAMFKVFLVAEFVATPAGQTPDPDRVHENRLLLAQWVEMLNAARRALEAATVAAADDTPGGVGELIVTSQTLSSLAQDFRRTLAGGAN